MFKAPIKPIYLASLISASLALSSCGDTGFVQFAENGSEQTPNSNSPNENQTDDESADTQPKPDVPVENPDNNTPKPDKPALPELPNADVPSTEPPIEEQPAEPEAPEPDTPEQEVPEQETPSEPDTPDSTAGTCTQAQPVDDQSALLFQELDFAGEPAPAANQFQVTDGFGRPINQYGLNLLDWQGYLANPFVKVYISGPENARYPLQFEIEASGTSRLMLNKPSTLSAYGAQATRTLNSAQDQIEIMLAIHPDRGGNFSIEKHRLSLNGRDANGATHQLDLPIRVLDQDEYFEAPAIPIKIDTRYDNLGTGHFQDPAILSAASQAINDWFYFFDLEPFDPVASGQETLWLAGADWQNHETVSNNESFNGLWVFLRSFSGPYSTGYPANNGKYHSRQGQAVAGAIHRSVTHILHFYENAELFTSLDDELWYLSDIRKVSDVYGLVMHEFGHAIAYHSYWSGMANYHKNEGQNANDVVAYQGKNVPLDNSYHITDGAQNWDRLSGQSGGWTHLFPERRWMNTKLSLLITEQAGWPVNRNLTPFLPVSIESKELPQAHRHCGYRYTLAAEGGIPFYDWQIVAGQLPEGMTLDRYTGTLNAETLTAQVGTYEFTVQLNDSDEQTAAAQKTFSLRVN